MSGHLGIKPLHKFSDEARKSLLDRQLRANLGFATGAIRVKRARAAAEVPDWQELRVRGAEIKDEALAKLAENLEGLERQVEAHGGQVHWAKDAQEAVAIAAKIAKKHGVREVVKVKSITTDEIGLNDGLSAEGIGAVETDLAELICQLANDSPSHILVPAIHKNRLEIRALFEAKLGAKFKTGEPSELAEAARCYLRDKFLSAKMAVSGANIAVAENGAVFVVESEGNGRMCLTLPKVLVTVMGIEKVLPFWQDAAVFLRLLPRSSTAERMNPYTSVWTGVRAGDGPEEFHLILLDNGRTSVLSEPVGRQTLRCIRCSACLNVCPVYERVGGHAYGSVYPGPIGAILTPQLTGSRSAQSLPFASSLCGACAEVCPVKIDIPEVLVHLRGRAAKPAAEAIAMRLASLAFANPARFMRALRLAPFVAKGIERQNESFRDWWRRDGQ